MLNVAISTNGRPIDLDAIPRDAPPGPIAPGHFALATPDGGAFVGSVDDRPEPSYRLARKFSMPADAELYRLARSHLHSTRVVGPFPGEG
jgi:hypothetical protein